MKNGVLVICLLGIFAEGSLLAQQSETVKAFLGNDPKTTVTTGIGQVVKPVGQPVIQSPTSIYNQTINAPATTLIPPGGPRNTYKGIEGIEDKAEGKEGEKGKEIEEGALGEVTEEEVALPSLITTTAETKFIPKKIKVVEIPEQKLPAVQTIPYQ